MKIKFKLLSDKATIPTRGSDKAAAYDLYSTEDYVLQPSERKLFKTDVAIQQDEGFYGKIEGRSGLAYKNGILTLAGVIDEDFLGNVGVILLNTGLIPFEIKRGNRIAQIIFQRYYIPEEFVQVEEFIETTRAGNGFGSTGS